MKWKQFSENCPWRESRYPFIQWTCKVLSGGVTHVECEQNYCAPYLAQNSDISGSSEGGIMKWKCEQCWAKCELDLPDRNKITPEHCPFMGTIPAEWIKAKIVMGGCSFTEQDIDRLVELIIDRLNAG